MKLTKRERAHTLAAIRYMQANLDDVKDLGLSSLEGIKPMSHHDMDKLYFKMSRPDFEVGDKVLCTPLNLPNGERAPNRNFEEPFIGTLFSISHKFDTDGYSGTCLVKPPKGLYESRFLKDADKWDPVLGMDLSQISHPED